MYLGLDGGGTGCRAVLTDDSGQIIGRGTGGPCNIMSDRDGAVAALTECAAETLAGRDPAGVTAVLGLAGVNTSGAGDWLPPLLPFGRSRVVQDAMTAAYGALGDSDGIVAAMGTGSIFIRKLGDAITTIGGWGPILGDEGSGNWLGRRFLSEVLRAGDGLTGQTVLTRQTESRHGGRNGIVAFARDARASDFGAEVAHLLAARDDPVAIRVLSEAAELVAVSIAAIQKDELLPVTFTGGLGTVYAALLKGRWPQREPLGNPLDGALRMARTWAADGSRARAEF
ncbi:BadF/BadG/BcrA/BcrD ATPase family protein [Paracoccus aurantiacus]|nr:BadF/BadG/BcrA/BcrD ATPase family protein [Paracoccus aurantiacus]